MGNVVFIHAGNLIIDKFGTPNEDRCQSIIDEISKNILDSKLYEDVDQINLELIGDPNIKFDVPKGKLNYNGEDIYQWEFPTLYKIIEHCKNNPNDNILYLHTKGSSSSKYVKEFKYIEDIRKYQSYWNITKYKDSLKWLKEFDVCGAELIYNPVRHYSHNFWWARASHINTLQDPQMLPVIYDVRHKCEFWIGSNNESKYKSVFNIYDDFLTAVSYDENLYK